MNTYTTGYISKQLNLSVRTLRYYDQIGLVTPSMKEDSGKRLYSEEEIFQLEKVCLLKKLKLPLKDIQQVLHQITTQQVLDLHQQSLQKDLHVLQSSLKQTNQLRNSLKIEGKIEWELLLPLLHSHNPDKKTERWNDLFQEHEQNRLVESMPNMNEDTPLTKKWIQIIKRIELYVEEGKSPQSKWGQLLAEDVKILSEEMFQGDQELEAKFWEARSSKSTSQELGLYPVKEEVICFLEKAMDYDHVTT